MCWYVRVLGPLYRSRVQRLQVGDVDFRGLEGETEREKNRGTHERTIERTAPVYFNKGGGPHLGPHIIPRGDAVCHTCLEISKDY